MEKGDITESADSLLSYECHLKHAAPSFQEIEELDNKLSQLETEVKEMNDNEANLQRNYLELVELQVCRRACLYIALENRLLDRRHGERGWVGRILFLFFVLLRHARHLFPLALKP